MIAKMTVKNNLQQTEAIPVSHAKRSKKSHTHHPFCVESPCFMRYDVRNGNALR